MPYLLPGLLPTDETNGERAEARSITFDYRGRSLSSHFQPIFSVAHRRAIGYEGLIRSTHGDGTPESPAQLLSLPANGTELLWLDRLCRALHVANFTRQLPDNTWLFVNLNSQCLISEQPDIGFTRALMETHDLPPQRLVIEVIENEVQDPALLGRFIDHFRRLGCLIAIDDFGAGHSNFDRIWQLEPDIVKLDRSLIQRAAVDARVERILARIVSLLHEAGSLVIVEGVENEREARVAIGADADMVQGFYFARPAPDIGHHADSWDRFDKMLGAPRPHHGKYASRLREGPRALQLLLESAVSQFHRHGDFATSSAPLFSDARTVRAFLLDDRGNQIGPSIYGPIDRLRRTERFTPLACGEHANWSHKDYHYRALQQPGKMHISEPYLSVADGSMCITVSQALTRNGRTTVYCCDLGWCEPEYTGKAGWKQPAQGAALM